MNIRSNPAEPSLPVPANSSTDVDAVAAVDFLSKHFSTYNIMAFEEGRCLRPKTPTIDHARAFIEEHPSENIYFSPADLRDSGFVGKPRKGDCRGSRWAWVDLDPPKDMTDENTLASWRQSVLAELADMDLPRPQLCVLSGRGIWFWWRLPFQLPPEAVEAINYALADCLGGDKCHSIDHVARLPFTRNSKTGVVATVLWSEQGTASVERLPSMSPTSVPRPTATVDIGGDVDPFQSEREFQAAVEQLSCPDATKAGLLMAALDPAAAVADRIQPFDINDRSAVMFSFAIKALMAGMSPEQVRNAILSPALPAISAHLLDTRKYRIAQRISAANRHVHNAAQRAAEYDLRRETSAKYADADVAVKSSDGEEVKPLEVVSLAPIPEDLPARPWLTEGLLMDGQVSMLTGRGGEGKSLLALQFGIMAATGAKFAWWSPRSARRVLMLNAEDNIDEQQRRLAAACEVMGIQANTVAEQLLTIKAERFVLVHRDPDDNKIKTAPLYGQLLALIRERQIGLLIVDPLIETHVNLDENSNVDMKELVLHLRALARLMNIPVLLVHHSRKGATGGDQDGARGGSALVNACRIVITLERMTDTEHGKIHPPQDKEHYVRVTGAKSNYAGRIGDRWLKIEQVELPNGDQSPGFRQVEFGGMEEGFDVHTWPSRQAFLDFVRAGTGTRAWSAAKTGPAGSRLDAAMRDPFKVDAGQAQEIISAFEEARLIRKVSRVGVDRKKSEVWVLPDQDDRAEPIEYPF
ncbi:AAA family ATPase [Mesorhizobium sp. VK22B]|uniref:AAA family ATPase n=1 Tax=Mesorhizobium captivum TaxID=3072319 RepID=A0ABU4Z5Z2_9HYPH|nr:AAA family ATPase [Mesorhizobium sp. VK22B]MDX8494626.1 AAA family ATPase [Mesorhizobium sp. VK22B]